MSNQGIGNGKIILFGEHFVVHGCPAIALGIANKAIIEIKKSDDVITFRTDVIGCIPELTKKAVDYTLKGMKITDKFHVYLKGDLPTVGGLGSSAAFCVGLVRALDKEYALKLSDEQINNYAYEGEKAFHGEPSGVDNTVATYGGAIKFIRGKGFEKLKIGKTMCFVVASTGKSSPTSQMVAGVRAFKEKHPEKFKLIFNKIEQIISQGEKAIADGDLDKIGHLMNENHKLLYEVGVSILENEKIIEIFKTARALGAKLTGGGGGGCCIALAKDINHAKEILIKIKENEFDGFVTTS